MKPTFSQIAGQVLLRGHRKRQILRRMESPGESPKLSGKPFLTPPDLKEFAALAIVRDAEKKGQSVDPEDMPPVSVETWVEFDPVSNELRDYLADNNAELAMAPVPTWQEDTVSEKKGDK